VKPHVLIAKDLKGTESKAGVGGEGVGGELGLQGGGVNLVLTDRC
jgi:hypothetical protein